MRGPQTGAHGSDTHLLRTTRGKILVLLCRQPQTVAELAGALGVTDNAVRAHLDRLERRRFVRQVGSRPGVRRPHTEYAVTDRARELFPRAYEPVLAALLEVLAERLPEKLRRTLLLRTGDRLLRDHVRELRGRSPQRRLAALIGGLNGSSLGIDVVEERAKIVVRSCSCPLASVVASHHEVCDVLATTLGKILHADVRERCDRTGSPRCCFEIVNGPRR